MTRPGVNLADISVAAFMFTLAVACAGLGAIYFYNVPTHTETRHWVVSTLMALNVIGGVVLLVTVSLGIFKGKV